jgi:hypothetical protein
VTAGLEPETKCPQQRRIVIDYQDLRHDGYRSVVRSPTNGSVKTKRAP